MMKPSYFMDCPKIDGPVHPTTPSMLAKEIPTAAINMEDTPPSSSSSVTKPTTKTSATGFNFYKKTNEVPPFWKEKYKKNAHTYWDKFYKSNSTNFYKDRHWILREFSELLEQATEASVLEVGCGVGNTLFPLLEETKNLKFFSFDFAPKAVDLLKTNPLFDPHRVHPFCCDVVTQDLPTEVTSMGVDFTLLIFVLSAIPPEKIPIVLRKIHQSLKPGGLLLFRDYAINDMAQKRLEDQPNLQNKMGDNFFVRSDGTMALYFSQGAFFSLLPLLSSLPFISTKSLVFFYQISYNPFSKKLVLKWSNYKKWNEK
jgi:methyltransferase-like protein 6